MGKIITKGRILFGIVVVALGVENLVCAHFGLRLPGVPWVPVNPFFAYISGAALIAGGTSIAASLHSRLMATLLGYLFLGCVLFRALPQVVAHPADWTVYGVLCEALALGASAWTLAQTLPRASSPWEDVLGKVTASGPYLFAACLVVFGSIHFVVARFIASLIPLDSRPYVLGLSDRDGPHRVRNQYCHSTAGPVGWVPARSNVPALGCASPRAKSCGRSPQSGRVVQRIFRSRDVRWLGDCCQPCHA